MQRTTDLFVLIRSLTPAEKRYFKQYATLFKTGAVKSHYLKLFDAMNKWPDEKYDEPAFKRKYKGKVFIKNLADEKNYLFELLLKIMRPFAFDNGEQKSTFDLMTEIRFLENKGLIKEAIERIKKTCQILEEKEEFAALLILLDWHYHIWFRNPELNLTFNLESYEHVTKNIVRKIELNHTAHLLRSKFDEFDNKEHGWKENLQKTGILKKEAEILLAAPLLPMGALSKIAPVVQNYLYNQRDFAGALDFGKQIITALENRPDITSTSQPRLTIINSYLNAAARRRQFAVILDMLNYFKNFTSESIQTKTIAGYFSVYWECFYRLNTSTFLEMPTSQIRTLTDLLGEYKTSLDSPMFSQCNAMLVFIHFLRSEWDNALNLINKIKQSQNGSHLFQKMLAIILPIEFLCHAALGHFLLLESLLRHLRRFYKKNGFNHVYCGFLCSFYSVIVKDYSITSAKVKSAYAQLLTHTPPREFEPVKGMVNFLIRGEFIPTTTEPE